MLESYKELLLQLDELQEAIIVADKVNKKYDELKKQIKKQMVEASKQIGTDQLKWTTPNGTKITCSLGHIAELEKEVVQEFDLELLKKDYPDIYTKCLVDKEKTKIVKNATSDTLRITLPKKGEENE